MHELLPRCRDATCASQQSLQAGGPTTHHSRLMTSPTQKSPSMSVDMVTPAYVGSSPRSSQMLETMCVGTRTCSQAQEVMSSVRTAMQSTCLTPCRNLTPANGQS
jgi:hypothetical protein